MKRPVMLNEDDLELAEALRRSLEQTTLQESQLADALAESVRTHDHEVSRGIPRDQHSQIEQDLMNQTTSRHESVFRDIEADLLFSPIVSDARVEQWHVIGDRNKRRPRYIPRNLRRRNALLPKHNFAEADAADATPEARSKAYEENSYANARQIPNSRGKIPYRPPNLHSSLNSRHSLHDATPITASINSTKHAIIPPVPNPMSMHPRYEMSPACKVGNRSYPETLRNINEPLVVIDGQNVGCSYGAGGVSRFRARGVEVVLDFFFNQGIPAVAVIPRHKVDTRSTIVNDRVADDPDLLNKLQDQGRLAFTPAGVHDDHFLLSYAMSKNIDLISNDRFQKEIKEQETEIDARKLRDFLNLHLIPYTFIHGEFVPNPKQSQLGRSIHNSRVRT